jgi:uncharacterized LabA/DUF88 family protein
MDFHQTERIAVFIDGPELRATVGGIGFELDFKRLLAFFQSLGRLVRISFYHIDREDDEEHSLRPLTDWLEYNGYTTIACAGRESDGIGRRSNKNFLNVRMTVDALEIANGVDHVVIFSGDAVLGPLVDALKWRGKRVSVCSTLQLRPPMVADELRRRADQFVDIADIIEHIAKDPLVVVKQRRGRPAQRKQAPPQPQSPVRSQNEVDASTS